MYDFLSKAMDNIPCTLPDNVRPWLEALADARARFDASERKEKRQWLAVMGVIRQAIDRGEPWPGQEDKK
jgi:hypothetical protein